MNIFRKIRLYWIVPVVLIISIEMIRWNPLWAEGYAKICYPQLSALLSAFSSLFPFSLGDLFIAGAVLVLVAYPFWAWYKQKGVWHTVCWVSIFVMWVYVWFYLAWGINYFRLPFYERNGVPKVEYAVANFRNFLYEYVDGLNDSFACAGDTIATWYLDPFRTLGFPGNTDVGQEIGQGYRSIASRFGIMEPSGRLDAKWMLWSGGMSKVGVTGYMGPFFSEFHLNRDLLTIEYPFTYAHELAHRLGIAGEAEANLYAYLVTTASSVPEIRFSGYFSLLGYVMNNARRSLSEDEYRGVVQMVRSEILDLYKGHLVYWRAKYNPSAGKVQHKVYNAYLKSNKINSGTKNYSEVIGLLMSVRGEPVY